MFPEGLSTIDSAAYIAYITSMGLFVKSFSSTLSVAIITPAPLTSLPVACSVTHWWITWWSGLVTCVLSIWERERVRKREKGRKRKQEKDIVRVIRREKTMERERVFDRWVTLWHSFTVNVGIFIELTNDFCPHSPLHLPSNTTRPRDGCPAPPSTSTLPPGLFFFFSPLSFLPLLSSSLLVCPSRYSICKAETSLTHSLVYGPKSPEFRGGLKAKVPQRHEIIKWRQTNEILFPFWRRLQEEPGEMEFCLFHINPNIASLRMGPFTHFWHFCLWSFYACLCFWVCLCAHTRLS